MAVVGTEAEEAAFREGADLRANLISSGGEPECDYAIGRIAGQGDNTIALVGIALTDYGVLVAVPAKSWDRKKAKRLLPGDALSRVLSVFVPLAQEGDRSAPGGDPDNKIIMGILKQEYEDMVEFEEDAGNINFGVSDAGFALAPFAPALVAAARDHFSFLTASEGLGGGVDGPPGLDPARSAVVNRLSALEEGMARLLARLDGPSNYVAPQPKAGAKAAATGRFKGEVEGITPLVANQALQAGVFQEALMEMMGLMQTPAAPAAVPNAKAPLDESSEEEEEDAALQGNGAAGSAGVSDPVAKAVLSLSKIVGEIHKEKKKKKDKDIESILDRAEGGLGRESGASGGRSKAAALRQLQNLLHRNPRLIYEAIEKNLQEDWELSSMQPGIASSVVSARGWLEHRSRIQAYPSSVRERCLGDRRHMGRLKGWSGGRSSGEISPIPMHVRSAGLRRGGDGCLRGSWLSSQLLRIMPSLAIRAQLHGKCLIRGWSTIVGSRSSWPNSKTWPNTRRRRSNCMPATSGQIRLQMQQLFQRIPHQNQGRGRARKDKRVLRAKILQHQVGQAR